MKPFPPLISDEQAEDFVASADLTEYDPSEMVLMHFERTTGSGSVTLPEDLMAASLERAASLGVPLETFVRLAVKRALTVD